MILREVYLFLTTLYQLQKMHSIIC